MFNQANAQTCTYTYDDLARLANVGCGLAWSQTFSYDSTSTSATQAFGSILKTTGSLVFHPTYDLTTNRYSTLPAGPPSYDNNGNLKSDGVHSYNWDAGNRMQQIDFVAGAQYAIQPGLNLGPSTNRYLLPTGVLVVTVTLQFGNGWTVGPVAALYQRDGVVFGS